jgi:hypothetical protein
LKQLVDFRSSSITWLTPDNSYGRFAVEAMLTRNNESYFLTSGVMACTMYHEDTLIHEPEYLYQAAFSSDRYHIFRKSAHMQTEDSAGKNTDRFQSVTITHDLASVTEVHSASQVGEAMTAGRCLLTEIAFTGDDGKVERVIAPVKHINYHATRQLFQAETGPVLLFHENTFRTAYLAFNTTDRAEFLLQYPDYTSRKISVPCTITLYTYTA